MTFVNTKYKGKTTNKRVIDFNKSLAKKAYLEMHEKMLYTFYSLPLLTIKMLQYMSLREGAKIFGVHKNTFKNHLKDLINDIKNTVPVINNLWSTSTAFPEVFANITNYTPQGIHHWKTEKS